MVYKALSRLSHNMTIYEAGDTVTGLDDETARQLVADGIIEEVGVSQVSEPTPPTDEVQDQPADQTPAVPEAPANEAPLDNQDASQSASSQDSNENPPVEDQIQANVAQDQADSERLATEAGEPVKPTPSQIEEDIASIENSK